MMLIQCASTYFRRIKRMFSLFENRHDTILFLLIILKLSRIVCCFELLAQNNIAKSFFYILKMDYTKLTVSHLAITNDFSFLNLSFELSIEKYSYEHLVYDIDRSYN